MAIIKILVLVLMFSEAQAGPRVKKEKIPPLNANMIANPKEALTFGRYFKANNQKAAILIESADDNWVVAYDIQKILDDENTDIFQLLESKGVDAILAMAKAQSHITLARESLIEPLENLRKDHIAAGGNYPEHAEETALEKVFIFPKFSKITAPKSFVRTDSKTLLDYEVEVCVVSSRDIQSVQDFEQSYKGLFLCGDYSDRAELLRLIDVDDVEGGVGFTDAKSGDDRMPIGEFLVVPVDFEEFSKNIEFSLSVNGKIKQRSNTSKLILDFKDLVEKALKESSRSDWKYKGKNVGIMANNKIQKGQILLSGTPEGVIYNKPTLMQKIVKGTKWALSFSFLKKSVERYVLDEYIKDSLKKKTYLQQGDRVLMKSHYLGKSYQEIYNIDEDKK